MRVASPHWLIRTALLLVVCQPLCVGRAALGSPPANPLRDSRVGTPATDGSSAVRFVIEDHSGGADPAPTAARVAEERGPADANGSHRSSIRSWTVESASPITERSDGTSLPSQVEHAGSLSRQDAQVAPAAYDRPALQRRAAQPLPLYRGTSQEKTDDVQSSRPSARDADALAERAPTRDRLHGPSGLRTAQQAPATAAQRVTSPRPTGPPKITAPHEKTLKLALAGVSPSSRPIGGASQSAAQATGGSAEELLLQAHTWAGSARSEADYSRVIDICQRARSSQRQGQAADYAQQLASWALNRRGQLKANNGLRQQALADFEAAIHLDPTRWRAIHNRGVLAAMDGNLEAAFDDFDRTIKLQPRYAKAYSNRAALLVVAGRLPQALQDYRRAAELDSKLETAHRGQAKVCHMLGKLDEALAHYDEALRLAPDDAYTVARRADLLTDMGRYAAAAAQYDRAIALDPQLSAAYRGSAWLLATCPDHSIRNAASAVERAQMAIRLEPHPSARHFDTLAAAQACRGDFRSAAGTVERAIQLTPPRERGAYQQRLALYQHAKPYRLSPNQTIQQATYTR